MVCTEFQVSSSKTVTGSFRTYGHTYIRTYRGPKQGKPGRNRNSSLGSVLVSKHYWFVKQCWLVNITGLYRVQVSEKYRFLPQRFNILSQNEDFKSKWLHYHTYNIITHTHIHHTNTNTQTQHKNPNTQIQTHIQTQTYANTQTNTIMQTQTLIHKQTHTNTRTPIKRH